jgi:hypothetical protein
MYKKKICNECGKETYLFSRQKCKYCSQKSYGKSLSKDRGTKSNSLSKKPRKNQGELIVFKTIWEERPHFCQVCSVSLPVFDHWNYAHCLSKGSYPKFRLLKDNIILMCRGCHTQYDCGSTKDDLRFEWVLELKQKLKQKYYGVCD